ncbi:hypothetical protein BGZ91_007036, partial [Linnemannia elongata]
MFMTTHASNRVSIVDNPLILDRICDNLTKVDLLPCLQVSRYWFTLFQPHVIRRVEFVNLKKHQTWATLDSASRIRHLTIDIFDAGWFLDNPKSPCTNLHELHCVDYDYQIKRLEDYNIQTCPSIVDQTKNALPLIEINPKLRTLTWKYRDDSFTESVLKSLVTLKSLTLIHISIPVLPTDIRFKLYNNLPVGLQDFEFSYKSADIRTPKLSTTLLPALKQICLRGTRQRVPSHFRDEKTYISPFSPYSNPDSYYYGPAHVDYNDHHPLDDFVIHYYDIEVTTLIRRSPQLRDLVLRDHTGKLKDFMQLLIIFCPNLETIDLSTRDAVGQDGDNIETAALTTSPLSPGSRFTKLKEFRIEGDWQTITDTTNPFHIGTEASWTRCTQLKELVLYQEGGYSISDYCWNAPAHSRTISGAVEEDYSTIFSRLEKLKLSLLEPLWQECPCDYRTRFVFEDEGGWSDVEFDDDWDTIMRDVPAMIPEDDDRSREMKQATQREEWEHRVAFILKVRELYGRLKDLKQLRALEIEWCACSSIRSMALEEVLRLFYETEFDEDEARSINFMRREDLPRTSNGWWGPITTVDLSWLGLSWSTQAEQQERADTQKLSLLATKQSNVETNTSYAQL